MNSVHLIVSGDVQGVGFRAWVFRYAQDKSITGWVKNRDDGAVEVVAEGEYAHLEGLIKRCQHGPALASVAKVDVTWQKAVGELVGFEVVD